MRIRGKLSLFPLRISNATAIAIAIVGRDITIEIRYTNTGANTVKNNNFTRSNRGKSNIAI